MRIVSYLLPPVFSLLLTQAQPSVALADTKPASGAWLAYTTRFKFEDNLRAFLDLQPRFSIDSSRPSADGDLNAFILRGAFGYQLDDNFTSYFGYATVPTYEPKRVEHRLFQEISSVHIGSDLKFSNRLRFEQRFLEGVSEASLRGRYQSGIQKPLGFVSGLSLSFYDEVFFNFNDIETSAPKGFEQNRAFAGFNYQISSSLSFDFGYLNQYQERTRGSSDSITNIIFLGLISQVDLS